MPIRFIVVAMNKPANASTKTEIDATDRQIIAILQEDGRLSASEVANRIGNIAERTVRNRIASLLQNRHIVISAIQDPTTLGHEIQADILIETEPGQTEKVARQMVEHDQIGYLAAMTGEYNLGASVLGKSNTDIHEFIETKISTIPGVKRVNTSMVMRLFKIFGTRTSTAVKALSEVSS